MPRADVTIKTHDGNCPASSFTPAKGMDPGPQTELQQQLVCDPFLAPRGVIAGHLANQLLEVQRNPRRPDWLFQREKSWEPLRCR